MQQSMKDDLLKTAGVREEISFCRICAGACGVKLTIDENDRILDVRGDENNPLSQGYACYKGLQAEDAHHGPTRLTRPLKRQPDGTFSEISSHQALTEIAQKIQAIINEHGPESVALYCGNGSMADVANYSMQSAFLSALGSTQRYTTFTIDQSAKFVSFERMGGWAGGTQELEDSQVLMMFGCNPLVSLGASGILSVDPTRRLKQAKANGLKLIVIDPRHTETAKFSDLHLQPYPGQDMIIAAAMIGIILSNGWHDQDFCDQFVEPEQLLALEKLVSGISPELAEHQAGLPKGCILEATKMFAKDARKGMAISATGPNMAAYSNATQHLIDCLNVVCGRFPREGDQVSAIDVLFPIEPHAEVIPPPRSWNASPQSRIRGVGLLFGEKLTGTLSDEILQPGPGQIRCLIVDGGNPVNSIPDQFKVLEALDSLELLVTIDPFMTATSERSHYLLTPKMQYERAALPISVTGFSLYHRAFSQYSPPVIQPPQGSDVLDNWYIYWSLAKQLGVSINYRGVALDMNTPPTTDELLEIIASQGIATMDEIRQYPHGHIFDTSQFSVKPARSSGSFHVLPEDVAQEINEGLDYSKDPLIIDGKQFSHLIIPRRMRDFFNSNGYYLESIRARNKNNPAHLNPQDMKSFNLNNGDMVELESDHGKVKAIVKADDSVRQGVISIAQGWGGNSDKTKDVSEVGTCLNPLIADNQYVEAINAMPRMSAIPVNIRPV